MHIILGPSFPSVLQYLFYVLAHLRRRLKWALSVARRNYRCRKLFTYLSSTKPLGQFQPYLAQNILTWLDLCWLTFSKGNDSKIAIMIHRHLKVFFFRTTWPNSNELGTKHPCVKWIQVCSNEKPRPYPRVR